MKAPRLEGVKDRKHRSVSCDTLGYRSARFLRRIVDLHRPLHCMPHACSPPFISINQLSVPLDHAPDS